jgi:hypothetical protein
VGVSLAGHQIDRSSENALHPCLQFYHVEQGEPIRPGEIEEHITVRSIARLVAGDRSKQEQCPDPGVMEFGCVLPQ